MTDTHGNGLDAGDVITLSADIVSAYVTNNHIQPAELAKLITDVHAALVSLSAPVPASAPAPKATPQDIRRSMAPDFLVSFEDGKRYKTLRRHLSTRGLTPESYRAKHGLPADYPMVSPSYSEQRSSLARSIGLGRPAKTAATAPAPEPEAVEAPASEGKARRGGRRKAA